MNAVGKAHPARELKASAVKAAACLWVAGGRQADGFSRCLDTLPWGVEWTPPDSFTAACRREQPAVILVDRASWGGELAALPQSSPDSVLILVGEAGKEGTGLAEAAAAGFDLCVPKDISPLELRRIIELELRSRQGEHSGADPAVVLPGQLGNSKPMAEVWRRVLLAASSDASVLLVGETGVGKEVVARALHRFSRRRRKPFLGLNCAALPEALLESELFGHEKGAFTGAVARRVGRFEQTDGGTLLLDEVGELPMSMQVKLLRVLQERAFERVGGTQTRHVDVRLIGATNRALEDAVGQGQFRQDLFYRLNVFPIRVPPLRERQEDILALWEHFTTRAAHHEHRGPMRTTIDAQRWLLGHDWPGNLRELENTARQAVTLAVDGVIDSQHLPEAIRGRTEDRLQDLRLTGLTLKELEQRLILDTYEAVGSNAQKTAEMLGISVRKVHYRLKAHRNAADHAAAAAQHRAPRVLSEPSAEAGVGTATAAPTAARKRLLLAEDDADVRWGLGQLLERDGYEVVSVDSGTALLEQLGAALLLEKGQVQPDAIITDLRMPGVNGLRLLEGVRARGWHVPVIMISAFGDEAVRTRASQMGVTAFLDKPIRFEKLRELLAQMA